MGACCSTPDADRPPLEQVETDATGGLADMYEVKHLLGSGSAGDTWLCRDRATGELLAVKLMKRPIPRVMGNNIMREVKIGAQLGRGHLNIVKPKELILTRTHLGIVMEYVAGGNMADYILKTILLKFGSFDTRDGLVMEEDEARYFFTQVINAVDYCHKNKVAHRDLKMDNTLLDDNDPPRIKLCDFGFAKWWTEKPNMHTITGTPDYMSPELLGAKATHQQQALYDGTKADIWAAGVMLCVMLIGRFPFEGIEMSNATNLEEVSEHVWRQQNSQRWYDNPLISQDCMMLSPDCMDLLNKIFNLDQAARITIPQIRQHPWFVKPLPPPYNTALTELMAEQSRIDEQVNAGAFVSKDRDAALTRMIEAASSRYNPEQEQQLLRPSEPGGQGAPSLSRLSASMLLRRISLTSIKPFHQDDTPVGHGGLNAVNELFSRANGTTADGQQASAVAEQGANGQQAAQTHTIPQQQQQQQQQSMQLERVQQQQQQQQQGLQPPTAQLSPQQQHLPQEVAHNSSGQPPGLVAPAGSSPGQSPTQQVELTPTTTATTAAAAAAAGKTLAGVSPQPPPSVSVSEIQVT